MENDNFFFSYLNPKGQSPDFDKYPDFLDTALKIVKSKDIKEVTLTDLGFPIDVPLSDNTEYDIDLLNGYNYKTNNDAQFKGADEANRFYIISLLDTRSREESFSKFFSKAEPYGVTRQEAEARLKSSELFGLEAEQAEELIDELKTLIYVPMDGPLEDVYKFFKLSHRPLYWALGNIAYIIWQYEQDEELMQKVYEQSIEQSKNRIKQDILNGVYLSDIYEKSDVTKKQIKEVVRALPYDEMPNDSKEKLKIETILFGIKYCRYTRNVSYSDYTFDFAVYRENDFLFLIDYDAGYYYKYLNTNSEIQEQRRAKEEYCRASNIPLLRIDYMEFEEEETEEHYVSTEIRNAFKNPLTAEEHNIRREAAAISYYIQYVCYHDEEYANIDFCGNYEDSITATVGGCYNCGAVFTPDKIKNRDDYYPKCPYCESQTVIFDSQGFYITEKIMSILSDEYWDYIGEPKSTVNLGNDELIQLKKISKIIINYIGISSINDEHTFYTEQITIDGGTEEIIYCKEEYGRKITYSYCSPHNASSFIQEHSTLFRNFDEDNSKYDEKTPKIEIEVFYADKTERFQRSYNRNGLPKEWKKFMDDLGALLFALSGRNDLFNEKIYNTGLLEDEYIFLSVTFGGYGKEYYYLTDDDTIGIGDYVMVPVGYSNDNRIVRVVNKEYFDKHNAPMPIEKVKSVISKCIDKEEETAEKDNTD